MEKRGGGQIMKSLLAISKEKPSDASSGLPKIESELRATKLADREKAVLDAFSRGEVPKWLFQWRPISVSAKIDGETRRLEYEVLPDYLSLGDEQDYFRVPMTPATAQELADRFDAILPSSRMVNEIYANASAKLNPQPIFPNLQKPDETSISEIRIQNQMKSGGILPGNFIAGIKKDIVVGPKLDGSRVAIYGWHDPSGANSVKNIPNGPIQPYSTIHDSAFWDYSHGVRLVKRRAYLDGSAIDIAEVFRDPKLHILVSDQGPFEPRFPNAPRRMGLVEDVGSNIADVQKALLDLGIGKGVLQVDGQPSPILDTMIAQFQALKGLPVSGKIDDATLKALGIVKKETKEASALDNPYVLAGLGVASGMAAYFAYKAFTKKDYE